MVELHFVFYRRQSVVITVMAHLIIKHLDVIKNILPNLIVVCTDAATHAFSFDQLKKALYYEVVAEIASPTHAGNEVVLF